jgi:hypothetical protein
VDVSDDLNGLFSVPVFVPAHTPAGTYPVVGDGDPRFSILGPSITFVVGPPGGVTIVPEPAALLPLAAAFPLLRRRIERLGMRAGGRGRSGARSEPR